MIALRREAAGCAVRLELIRRPDGCWLLDVFRAASRRRLISFGPGPLSPTLAAACRFLRAAPEPEPPATDPTPLPAPVSETAAALRRLRESLQLNQRETAAFLRMSQSTLCRMERGRPTRFSAGKALRRLQALRPPPEDEQVAA